jgi:hypothetical protein
LIRDAHPHTCPFWIREGWTPGLVRPIRISMNGPHPRCWWTAAYAHARRWPPGIIPERRRRAIQKRISLTWKSAGLRPNEGAIHVVAGQWRHDGGYAKGRCLGDCVASRLETWLGGRRH